MFSRIILKIEIIKIGFKLLCIISRKKWGTMRPLLRWAGSKKQILNHLAKYWNNSFNRYIEPFAGSASLFFKLLPQKAILNDLNSDLINTYLEIKNNPNEIIKLLKNWGNSREDYYKIRSMTCDGSSSLNAARFIYLNNNCFNGLYRTNLKGNFNVPYGGEKSGRKISSDEIMNISQIFAKIDLLNKDFEEVLAMAKSDDFVYLDPPYRVSGTESFIEYGPIVFSEKDLSRLERSIQILASNNTTFLLSYIESKEGEELAKKYSKITFSMRRNISGFTKSPKIVNELLISNIDFLL